MQGSLFKPERKTERKPERRNTPEKSGAHKHGPPPTVPLLPPDATPEQRALRAIWDAWWDKAPEKRCTVWLESPWWDALAMVGDLTEPGWRDRYLFDTYQDLGDREREQGERGRKL
jgi:hypothetical protein